MAVCISCGNEIAENAKFCINCGAPAVQENTAVEKEEIKTEEAVPVAVAAAPESAPAEPAAPVETEFIPKPLFAEHEKDKKSAYDSVVIPTFTPEKQEPAAVPAEDPEKPGKKSKWGIISTKGYIGINLLMAIPVVGLILTIIWACGGCRKYAKRNYARAALIFMAIGIILLIAGALVLRFVFPEVIVQVFEMLYPGYTIVF